MTQVNFLRKDNVWPGVNSARLRDRSVFIATARQGDSLVFLHKGTQRECQEAYKKFIENGRKL